MENGQFLPVEAELNSNRIVRIILTSQNKKAVLYSASSIEILDLKGLEKHTYISRLGPDVLDKDIDHKTIFSRLTNKKFRNRAFASLYLDQSFLAGIGNYLRTEILWSAGLSPFGTPFQNPRTKVKKKVSTVKFIHPKEVACDKWLDTYRDAEKKFSKEKVDLRFLPGKVKNVCLVMLR